MWQGWLTQDFPSKPFLEDYRKLGPSELRWMDRVRNDMT